MILDQNPDRLEPQTEWLRDLQRDFRNVEQRELASRKRDADLRAHYGQSYIGDDGYCDDDDDGGPAVVTWIVVGIVFWLAVIAFLVIGGR